MSTAPSIEIQRIEDDLGFLRQRLDSIVVRTQEDYRSICEVEANAKTYIKRVGAELDPGIAKAKDTLDHLKNQKAKYVDPAKMIQDAANRKGIDFKTEERRKAEAEQHRINEERRLEAQRKADEEQRERNRIAEEQRKLAMKEAEAARKAGEIDEHEAIRLKREARAAAQWEEEQAAADAKIAAANVPEVIVAPSIPVVSGKRNQQRFYFEVLDASKLPRHYLMQDDVAIGRDVRDWKDCDKAMLAIPGIRCWSEG
jgi:hypothetical protein